MRHRFLPARLSRRGRRAAEAGFALPTVLFLMLGAFAIGSAAAVASIAAQKGTTRDHDTKAAITAAEAGVSQALLRYNRVRSGGTTSSCLLVSGSTMVQQEPGSNVDGWCDGVEGEMTDGSQFVYWVRPTANQVEIVSQGSAAAVTRRVEVTAISQPQPGLNPFEDATVIGLNSVQLSSNANADADIATNGDVEMGSNATLCGDAQVGIGHGVTGGSHSCGSVSHGDVSLPPVNQGDVVENNSNWRLFDEDPISGSKSDVTWDPLTRELTIDSNSAVTLGGSNYSLCKLTMDSNATLYIAAGAQVNIFFDDPENCGYGDGVTQLEMRSNSSITPNAGDPTSVSLLFVGHDSLSTNIRLRSNTHANAICGQDFVIYAPRTDIQMDSNSHYCGAMAGKSVHLASNAKVRASNLAENFELPNTTQWSPYWRDRFVECSGPASSPPNNAC